MIQSTLKGSHELRAYKFILTPFFFLLFDAFGYRRLSDIRALRGAMVDVERAQLAVSQAGIQ